MNWAPDRHPNTNREIEGLAHTGQLSSHYKTFVIHVNKSWPLKENNLFVARPDQFNGSAASRLNLRSDLRILNIDANYGVELALYSLTDDHG